MSNPIPTTTEELITKLEPLASWNSFANDLINGKYGYIQRGYLTANQIDAAERMLAKLEAKEERKATAKQQAVADSSTIDLIPLPDGRYAVPDGDTRLKVRVRRPKKDSNWFGYIFVSDAAVYGSSTNYGKQAPNNCYSGKIQKQLRAILADPTEALLAYGHLTGSCGMCGKVLEDPISIAMGIGPVCAAKIGLPRPAAGPKAKAKATPEQPDILEGL